MAIAHFWLSSDDTYLMVWIVRWEPEHIPIYPFVLRTPFLLIIGQDVKYEMQMKWFRVCIKSTQGQRLLNVGYNPGGGGGGTHPKFWQVCATAKWKWGGLWSESSVKMRGSGASSSVKMRVSGTDVVGCVWLALWPAVTHGWRWMAWR